MRVSEVARRAGIAPSAVRFYEEVGVLPRVPRSDNGYRDYDDVDLARLRLVVSLRRLGLGRSMPVDSPGCAWNEASSTPISRRSSARSAPQSAASG